MSAPILDFTAISHEAALERCRKSKKDVETAWRQHLADVLDFRKLGTWKAHATSWAEFCHANLDSFYEASTYRTQLSSSFIALMVEQTANVQISESEARKLGAKLNKVCNTDLALKGAVYSEVYEDTGELFPSEQQLETAFRHHYNAKHEKILEIGGEDVTVGDVLSDNIRYELGEIKGRKSAHIDGKMGIESKRVELAQKEAVLAFMDSMGIGYASDLNPRDFAIVWKQDKVKGSEE